MIKTVSLFVWGGLGGGPVCKKMYKPIHDIALSILQGSELASSLVMLL